MHSEYRQLPICKITSLDGDLLGELVDWEAVGSLVCCGAFVGLLEGNEDGLAVGWLVSFTGCSGDEEGSRDGERVGYE